MAQSQAQAPNMDQFEVYFKRADLDQDGRISGNEAVSFFQATNLPRPVLAQIWTIADQNRTGFLGRQEFYNALKLVTVAQSKRELTPEIVKAALNSPASAKIPAPKIDLTPSPGPRSNIAAPPTAGSAVPPQNIGISGPQGFTSPQIQVMRPPRPPFPSATFQTPQVASDPRMPYHGGTRPVSHPPSSSPWVGGNTGVSQAGLASQSIRSMGLVGQDSVAVAASGLPPPSTQPGAQAASVLMKPASSITSDTSVVEAKDSKALDVAANGYASDSLFGDVFSATSVQTKQDSTKVTSGVSSLPVSSTIVPVSSGAQPAVKSSPHDSSLQMTTAQPPVGSQQLQGQLPVKPNQRASVQASSAFPTGAVNSAAWPRMTQSDVQKYTKVFMQVGSYQDGKITGEQARDLFLSWGLPREVLKRVWDLSDQDNDSKLSLREFCIALYLMERYREGRPLPAVLPSGIMFDESVSPVTNQPVAPRGNTAWRATSPFQQPHSMKPPLGRPPRPIPGPAPQSEDSMHPSRQKPKVPVLEKHLLDQLSTEEQSTLNSKFQEASDAEKKVAELEKEILDAREKIQFFHAKMQELILYKSRCDNRLNEITERVSADKREVENLGKKYEEKYRQAGDVASKLTIEEATFRDIQEKKMELYRAIVKLEQDGSADGIQERTNLIQLDLEELVKSLNERCKTYGLRAKPTSLVELPFGWQPGIQEGAADWDENWDKFEDEGFSFVKELTLDVQNVIAPPKSKSSLREKESSVSGNGDAKSSSDDDGKAEMAQSTSNQRPENDGANTLNEDYSASSPPESPARSNAPQSELKEFEDSHSKRDISFDGSPHATQSEHGGAESMFSADKGFDEPGWGTFDTPYDTDAASEFNYKDVHSEKQSDSLFGSDEWSLNPIRTSTSRTDNMYPKQSPFFDSVPSTPSYNIGGSPLAESMFQKKSPFGFADSIPSTPLYSSNNSPRRFGEGPEGISFDSSFSRFDSFNMQDGGLFTPREPLSFTRFDSMRSTRDSEYDHGSSASRDSLARFDSFRSMADSDYNFGLFPPRESFTRFDSIRSTRDSDFGHGFSSFDEADPFGSSDPFKTTLESQTPRRDSDGWNDHFNTSFESQTPRRDSDSWSDAFKTSFDSQTPRRDSDSWNDPFKTSFESQTPRRDSDSWKAF